MGPAGAVLGCLLGAQAPVDELVATGAGLPFAPNGKVFREWIAFPVPDEEEWSALLDEAKAFARG